MNCFEIIFARYGLEKTGEVLEKYACSGSDLLAKSQGHTSIGTMFIYFMKFTLCDQMSITAYFPPSLQTRTAAGNALQNL